MDVIDYMLVKTNEQNEIIRDVLRKVIGNICIPFREGYFIVLGRPPADKSDHIVERLSYLTFVTGQEFALIDEKEVGRSLVHLPDYPKIEDYTNLHEFCADVRGDIYTPPPTRALARRLGRPLPYSIDEARRVRSPYPVTDLGQFSAPTA